MSHMSRENSFWILIDLSFWQQNVLTITHLEDTFQHLKHQWMGDSITLNKFQKQNAITLVTCTNLVNKVLQFTLVKGITVGEEKRGSKIKY